MKRQFFSALLMGAMVVGATTTLQSCKDYDDDIQNLQQQIDANSKAIKAIEDLIKNGSVITNVAEADNGVTVTLSDGKKFTIANGKDGENGTPGTAWTISEDGYWVKDGVKQSYKAVGQDGVTPTIGENGNWFIGSKDTGVKAKGENGQNGKTPTVEIKDGYWYINGENTKVKATGENGSSTTTTSYEYYVPNAETGCFDIWKDGEFVKATTISFRNKAQNGISAVLDKENLTLTGVKGVASETVVISLSGNLRGLVFMPHLYLDGIETIVYDYLTGTYKTLENGLTGKSRPTLKNDKNEAKSITGLADYLPNKLPNEATDEKEEVFNYGPAWGVQYHMNPSNANTKFADIKGYNVLEPEIINYHTRAAANKLGVTSPEKNDAGTQLFMNSNGILTAGLQVAHPELLNATPTTKDYNDKENLPNTIALQSATKDNSGNEATVTSDYALLQPEKAYVEALVWGKKPMYARIAPDLNQTSAANRLGDELGLETACKQKRVHVWDSPQEALADPDGAALEVYYDSKEGINISDYMALHAMKQNIKEAGYPYEQETWSIEEAAKWGLTFEYNLVDYKVDGNKTADSKFAKWVDKKNGQIRAWNVKYDETPQGETSPSAIDREPLVQVLVKRGDKVVLDGYILIHITKKPVAEAELPTTKIEKFSTKDANFDLCNDIDSYKTTWAQFNDYVLTQTLEGMEKNTFDSQYEPDLKSNSPIETTASGNNVYELKTFVLDANNKATESPLGLAKYYGNSQGTTNHVFAWRLAADEVEALTHHKTEFPVNVTRYVRYKAIEGSGAKYQYIYIKLSYNLTRDVVDTYTFGNKNRNYWFKLDGTPMVTGADAKAFVLDVKEPTDGGDIVTINRGIRSTLVENYEIGKTIVENREVNVKDFHKYYFVPKATSVVAQDGKTYTVTPKSGAADVTYNKLYCKHVTAPVADEHVWDEATLDKTLEECAIDYNAEKGAFTNDKLYAECGGVYKHIANLNQTTGEITLINNDFCQKVLNAVGYTEGHKNITTEMSAWLDIVVPTKCWIAKKTSEGLNLASWQRPINLKATEEQQMVDANTNGNTIYLIDILKMFDWRGEANGYMWGKNTWFWAYYNVKAITVDVTPSKVLTNMHYGTEHKLSEVTTQAELRTYPQMAQKTTYTFNLRQPNTAYGATNGFQYEAKNNALVKYMNENPEKFGAIYYKNNGDNVNEFYVKVPVTVEYEWGTFKTMVKINIKTTLGHE